MCIDMAEIGVTDPTKIEHVEWEKRVSDYYEEYNKAVADEQPVDYDHCGLCKVNQELYGRIPYLCRREWDNPDPMYCKACYDELFNRDRGFILEILRLRKLLRDNGIDPDPKITYYDLPCVKLQISE